MKKITLLIYFISIISYTQTAITDSNFKTAINTCLATNPIDGLCSDSEYGAMPDWDVSNVTNMIEGFNDYKEFNADISTWNVSNVTNMESLFRSTSFNQQIGDWDVSSVTNMCKMFSSNTNILFTPFNQDISNWDVSNVTNMLAMFNYSNFNQNISDWNVSNVTNMAFMFDGSLFNKDISNWDVSNVKNMIAMFQGVTYANPCGCGNLITFNQDISKWDVSSVTNMSGMFNGSLFNKDISSWNVSGVTNMSSMFSHTPFNQDISNWDVSNVKSMYFMFGYSSFDQNIGNWNISNIDDMGKMFYNSDLSTENYDAILTGWSTLDLKQNISLGAFGINYCNGQTARESIIENYNWIITDAGLDCNSLSIDNKLNIMFSVFPNPTKDYLFIKNNQSPKEVSVYNLLGEKIISTKNRNKIDLRDLTNGTYIIYIYDGVKQVYKKFIKH